MDEQPFTYEEAKLNLEALHYFLSFVRGVWCGPILPIGYDHNGKEAFRVWNANSNKLDTWQDHNQRVYSWFLNHLNHKCLAEGLVLSFPGFLHEWRVWGESIALAIHWYVESNKHVGGIEGSIVLEQAALELLSSIVLLEKKNLTGKKKKEFEDKAAAEKISQLLGECKIPQCIPPVLTHLAQLATTHNISDGPHIFTWIRNKLVHPTPNNRQRLFNISPEAKAEAWELGLWYIKLILLHLFDYQATYSNRMFRTRYMGDEQLVPWVHITS